MKKHEKALLLYSLIDNLIPYMDDDLQGKMKFARDYMNNMTIKDLENNRILLGPMDEKTLQFLIFSILLEYDNVKEQEKSERIDKDRFYLDTEEIFPIVEMTPEDVVFIEHCLDKINVDLESGEDEDIVLSTKQVLFLVRGIMREYDTFLNNGKKFEELRENLPPEKDWV
jgi:hypothetical protein